jgi:hypothetical protein
MSLYEWLLFLHLLAAFLLVAGLVAYGVIVFRRGEAVVSRIGFSRVYPCVHCARTCLAAYWAGLSPG